MMHEDSRTTTFEAAADLSAVQYHAVKISAAQKVNVATATTDNVFILLNDPISGQEAHVCTAGRCKAKIGGTVSAGDLLGPDADAMLNVRSSSGDKVFAIAREAGADGDIIDVEFIGLTVL